MTSARMYVLDACIVIAFQKTGHLPVLINLSERVKIVIIEEVQDELIHKASRHDAEQWRNVLVNSKIGLESIDANDPAATILATFRTGKVNDKDKGEAASIAWAVDKPGAMFISRDAGAAFHALEELRGRAMSFYQFLAELVELDAMDISVAAQVADDAARTPYVMARPPYWWPSFVLSRSAT
jgi:hypothetical protein